MILSDRLAPAPAPGTRRIEVVEPTLASEAGHCAALFASLRSAAPELPYRLWIDRRADLPGWDETATPLQRRFIRPLRKFQAWRLYRQLLASGAPILVPTASYFDLRALDLAARARIAPARAFLYFHKLRVDGPRQAALQALARRQPDLELFGTSEEIVARLQAAGFSRVRRVLPVLAADAGPPAPAAGFTRLLCAGAARADKGFGRVVDLVELLARTGGGVRIAVQTSGDHYGRYDTATRQDVERLAALRYDGLERLPDTLDAAHYAALFPGAVCLQPYAPAEYHDKMSAVTFDALRAGAPIVTVAGTTMAALVERSGAGVVIAQAEAPALLAAARTIIADYPGYQARALAAGMQYRPASSWAPMVERLREAVARASDALTPGPSPADAAALTPGPSPAARARGD